MSALTRLQSYLRLMRKLPVWTYEQFATQIPIDLLGFFAGTTQGTSTVVSTPAWNSFTTYTFGQKVTSGFIIYSSLQNGNTNHVPPNASWWAVSVADRYPAAAGSTAGEMYMATDVSPPQTFIWYGSTWWPLATSGGGGGGGGGVIAVTATAPMASSGGASPDISMAAATAIADGYMTSTYAAKLDGIEAGANLYVLPIAAAGTLGGIRVGSGLSIDGSGILSASGSAVAAATTAALGTVLLTVTDQVPANPVVPNRDANGSMTVTGNMADGASAIGVILNNSIALPNAAAKIVSFQSAGVEKAYINSTGQVVTPLISSFPLTIFQLQGTVADGGSAVAIKLNAGNVLTTAGAKIISVTNNNVEKMYVDKDGIVAALSFRPLTATSAILRGAVASSVSAVATILDNSINLTHSTAKIVSFQNAGVEKAYIDYVGLVVASAFNGANLVNPTANLLVQGNVADGAAAIGVKIGAGLSLTTAGSKIASFTNASVEKAYVDKDGNLSVLGLIGTPVTVSNISATGTPSSTTYLRGDGTWSTPAGGSAPTVTDDTTTNADYYLLFNAATSGAVAPLVSSTKLFYHPSTGSLGLGGAPTASRLFMTGDVHTLIEIDGTTSARVRLAATTATSGERNFEFQSGGGLFKIASLNDAWGLYTNQYIMACAPDGSISFNNGGVNTSAGYTFKSPMADAASAIALLIDTAVAYTSTAKLLSLKNNNVEKFYVAQDGGVLSQGSITATTHIVSGATGNVYSGFGTFAANSAVGATLRGSVADGASAIGVTLNNTVTLTNITSKIVSFQNNGVEKAFVDYTGDVTVSNIILGAGVGKALYGAVGYSSSMIGRPADGASAVAVILNSNPALTTSGSLLLSVRNNNVEKASIDYAGNMNLASAMSAAGYYGLVGNTVHVTSQMTNGAGAVAFYTDTTNGFINVTSKLVSFRNATVEKAYIGYDGQLGLIVTNTDYTNTAGAGSHIYMSNPSATGQNVVTSYINGTLRAKWRTDYAGNLSWVANGGSHSFYTGGDFPTGTAKLTILDSGLIGVGPAATTPTYQLEVVDEVLVTNRGMAVSQHNTGIHGASFSFLKSRGTRASPTAVASGDYGGFFANKFRDTASTYVVTGGFGFRVNGTVGSNSVPTDMFFYTNNAMTGDPYTDGTVRMILGSTGLFTLNTTTLTTAGINLVSKMVDGGSAIGTLLNTSTNYATTGAKLLSIRNNSVEKFYVYYSGLTWAADSIVTAASFYTDTGIVYANTAVSAKLSGKMANTAAAIATILDNQVTLSAAGAKLLSVRNNNVEKLVVDKDGYLGIGVAPTFPLSVEASLTGSTVAGYIKNTAGTAAGTISRWMVGALPNDGANGLLMQYAHDTGVALILNWKATTGTLNLQTTGGGIGIANDGSITVTGEISSGGIRLRSTTADGATAVGSIINTSTAYTTAGAKLLSIRNNTVEKLAVDMDGLLLWPDGQNIGPPVGSNVGRLQVFTSRAIGDASGDFIVDTVNDRTNSTALLSVRNQGASGLLDVRGDGYITTLLGFKSSDATNSYTFAANNQDTGGPVTGVVLDNINSLTDTGSKLLSIRNATVEKAYIDIAGRLYHGITWDDMQGPALAAQVGPSAPTIEAYRDTVALLLFFKHNQDDDLTFTYQTSHRWIRDTEVRVHIHYIPMATPATDEVVRIEYSYAWAHPDTAVPAASGWTTSFTDITIPASGADTFNEKLAGLFNTTPSGSKESSILIVNIKRLSSSASDTYTTGKSGGTAAANFCVLSVDAHFQSNKEGTTAAIPT